MATVHGRFSSTVTNADFNGPSVARRINELPTETPGMDEPTVIDHAVSGGVQYGRSVADDAAGPTGIIVMSIGCAFSFWY